jgi:hypothetical protein
MVKAYSITLKMATDTEYPNNNLIGFRSQYSGHFSHTHALMIENENGTYDFEVYPDNAQSDTIIVKNVNLLEFMPSIPPHIKKDNYLSFLAVLNQEWNRIQVKFDAKLFKAQGKGLEKNMITRFDIANNCLKKGLWELLAFNNDSLYYQSWFDFPDNLYNELFLKRNGISIDQYNTILKNYSFEKGKAIDFLALRTAKTSKNVTFNTLNNQYYPLEGERASKLKNIVFPTEPTIINDFLTDKTTYATFSPPGQYTSADPRKTQLSRFQQLEKVTLSQTVSANAKASNAQELHLYYTNNAKTMTTHYVIGGLDLDKLPILTPDKLHTGWQRPMGISNHSFYSAYKDFTGNSSLENAYFSFLLNENREWLDSHEVGIDGMLLYRAAEDTDKIHAYILSFERHSFVGHIVLEIPIQAATSF